MGKEAPSPHGERPTPPGTDPGLTPEVCACTPEVCVLQMFIASKSHRRILSSNMY